MKKICLLNAKANLLRQSSFPKGCNRSNRNLLLCQPGINAAPNQRINYGKQRNKQNNSKNARYAAANDNRQQRPDRRQTHRAADHPRINQISFYLLYYKEENDKPEYQFYVSYRNKQNSKH